MNKADKLGALWLKDSKSGHKYMSGVVKVGDAEVKVVVFKNNYKEDEKHPDYIVYESKPQDAKPKDDFADDIPF